MFNDRFAYQVLSYVTVVCGASFAGLGEAVEDAISTSSVTDDATTISQQHQKEFIMSCCFLSIKVFNMTLMFTFPTSLITDPFLSHDELTVSSDIRVTQS
jgi:hypothetical protein